MRARSTAPHSALGGGALRRIGIGSACVCGLSLGVGHEGIAKLQSAKTLLELEMSHLEFAEDGQSSPKAPNAEEESLHSILALLQDELEAEQERIKGFSTQQSQRPGPVADEGRPVDRTIKSSVDLSLIDRLSERRLRRNRLNGSPLASLCPSARLVRAGVAPLST